MNKLILVLIVTTVSNSLWANNVRVNGYTKKNGSYVSSHHRTGPDKTRNNNYSSRGNMNPYTGKAGVKNTNETHD